METKNIVIGLVAAVIVLAGGYFLWQGMDNTPVSPVGNQMQNEQNVTPNNEGENNGVDVGLQITAPKTHEVVLTDAGYAPATLTIKKGDIVVFKNQSSGEVWTGSAMHPSHVVYGGTSLQQHCPDNENDDFDQCKSEGPGTSWSFTFNKVGTWGYHNHVKANQYGKIVVE